MARDLTIRVSGEFSNAEYVRLAYDIHLVLRAAGLGGRVIFFPDKAIKLVEFNDLFGHPVPLRSRWLVDD